jgi:hypothetical protein
MKCFAHFLSCFLTLLISFYFIIYRFAFDSSFIIIILLFHCFLVLFFFYFYFVLVLKSSLWKKNMVRWFKSGI